MMARRRPSSRRYHKGKKDSDFIGATRNSDAIGLFNGSGRFRDDA